MTSRVFTLDIARAASSLDGEVEHLGPVAGRPSPQSNDAGVDDRRLIYLTDRIVILELRREPGASTACAAVGGRSLLRHPGLA
jgi:hypothetical protein